MDSVAVSPSIFPLSDVHGAITVDTNTESMPDIISELTIVVIAIGQSVDSSSMLLSVFPEAFVSRPVFIYSPNVLVLTAIWLVPSVHPESHSTVLI